MLDDKLCLTSVVEFLRRGRVDRGTREGKVVVVVDSSKQKVLICSPLLLRTSSRTIFVVFAPPLGGIVGGVSPPPIAKQDASLSSLHPLLFARAATTLPVILQQLSQSSFLLSLLLPPYPLFLWLIFVCRADGVWHLQCCYCVLIVIIISLALSTRGAKVGDMQGRKRAWRQLPRRQHTVITVLWNGGESQWEDVSWSSSSSTSLKTVFFVRTAKAKQMHNWRSSMHVQLNSTFTSYCPLCNLDSELVHQWDRMLYRLTTNSTQIYPNLHRNIVWNTPPRSKLVKW